MKIAVFGLTVSSSWGNGHATLWRGLIRALSRDGHDVIFFERDVPYYSDTRDLTALPGESRLLLYPDWQSIVAEARRVIGTADVAMVTSYCPDAVAASELIEAHHRGVSIFYDLDTPVTLARLGAGERPSYVPSQGLSNFDLVLSYTGGDALTRLKSVLGARRVAPLFGHVDPQHHRPAAPEPAFTSDLSYLATYAADRQRALDMLFIAPARACPDLRFVLGGSGYPQDFPWTDNIHFVRHLPPADHPAFFSSSRLTLNVTRGDMAAMGFCPSGRLFEAAACGTPVISDWWEGLETFFEPGSEILIARDTADVRAALSLSDEALARIAAKARRRVLAQHTSAHRARELIDLIECLGEPAQAPAAASASKAIGVR